METPGLRHFRDGKIYSDPVLVVFGEACIPAVYTDSGWETVDGTKLDAVTEWCNGQEADQGREENRQSDERIQGRNPEKRQARPRQRSNRKKP